MENIKGLIEEKSIKNSPEGSDKVWQRAAYKIAGKTLATFDEEIINKFNTGMKVDVDFEINTQGDKHYNNITTITTYRIISTNSSIRYSSNGVFCPIINRYL